MGGGKGIFVKGRGLRMLLKLRLLKSFLCAWVFVMLGLMHRVLASAKRSTFAAFVFFFFLRLVDVLVLLLLLLLALLFVVVAVVLLFLMRADISFLVSGLYDQ